MGKLRNRAEITVTSKTESCSYPVYSPSIRIYENEESKTIIEAELDGIFPKDSKIAALSITVIGRREKVKEKFSWPHVVVSFSPSLLGTTKFEALVNQEKE